MTKAAATLRDIDRAELKTSPDQEADVMVTLPMSEMKQQLESALLPVLTEMAQTRKFIDRRIAELGAEIHATVELVDMNDQTTTARLEEIHKQVSAMNYHGSGKSSANTGYELDAIVSLTEVAAEQILESAEKINELIQKEGQAGAQSQSVDQIKSELSHIFEACSFQDLAGQRIRKALVHLEQIEEALVATMDKIGLENGPDSFTRFAQEMTVAGLSQDAIDRLLVKVKKD